MEWWGWLNLVFFFWGVVRLWRETERAWWWAWLALTIMNGSAFLVRVGEL